MRMLTMTPAPEMPAIHARRPWYFLAAAAVALLALAAPHAEAQGRAKLSRDLEARLAAGAGSGRTDIIIDRLAPGAQAAPACHPHQMERARQRQHQPRGEPLGKPDPQRHVRWVLILIFLAAAYLPRAFLP